MSRALLKTDDPVAYRVVVTRTPKPEHAERLAWAVGQDVGSPLVQRFGPYGTLAAARGQAKSETGPYVYRAWDSTAVVEAIRAEAWTEVPVQ